MSKTSTSDPLAISYAGLQQVGPVINGPGAKRDTPYPTTNLTPAQQNDVVLAKKYAMDQSVRNVLVKQTLVHQNTQMAHFQMNIQRQQALALMCRVYVGSINFEIREDTVKQAFSPFGPMKSCSLSWDPILNKHKGFSFIEYDVPESAQLALDQMNNVLLGGRNIKVGRPSNMPQVMPIVEEIMKESLNYNRIFVASIHADITENDLKSVFEAFGDIVSCRLIMDPIRPTKHKGIAYIEYKTSQSCTDAINSMNLFDLGGQFIRVGRCVTPPHLSFSSNTPATMPAASALAAATVTARLSALDALTQLPVVPPSGISVSHAPLPPPGIAVPQIVGAPSTIGSLPPPGIAIPQVLSSPGAIATQSPANIPGVIPSALGSVPVMTVPIASLPTVGPRMAIVTPLSAQGQPLNSGQPVGREEHNVSVDLTESQKKLIEDDATMSLEQQESMKISGLQARNLVMQKLMKRSESRVMVLKNMVGPEDVDEELESEVTEECAKYGNVDKVIIYQEKQGEHDDAEIIVKIFVEFSKPSEMETAIKALNGRFFGGRIVQAVIYDQKLYDTNELSH